MCVAFEEVEFRRSLGAGLVLAQAVLVSGPVAGADRILSSAETVRMEHEDRLNRLKAFAVARLGASPRFYEYVIGRNALSGALKADIPVLRMVVDQRVFFDTDKDTIRPEAEAVIDVVADTLRGDPGDTAVFVAGHTDSRGGDAYNLGLSLRRAHSVALALQRRDIRQAKIWQVPFGEAVPIAPNTSEAGMAINRRVEFLFSRKAEAVGVWLSRQRDVVCVGADPAARIGCLDAFDRLGGVVASPVGRPGESEKPVEIPHIGTDQPVTSGGRDFVAIDPRIPIHPPAPQPPVPVPAPGPPPVVVDPPPRQPPVEVVIRPDEPIVIDLRQQRVLVEKLER